MDNDEIKKRITELNMAAERFRPDGAAKGVMQGYQTVINELYGISQKFDMVNREKETFRGMVEKRNKLIEDLDKELQKLKKTEFSFDEFQRYLTQLYRVLKVTPTFKLNNKEDLPKLMDFLYAEYVKKGAEPDVP